MAYNPYLYYPYNPYQTQQYQTPQYQAPQNASPTPTSIIWVSGDKEASMYPVAPNNAVTMWSQTEPVVYLKQADASGRPTMKVYDLVERTEQPHTAPDGSGDKNIPYATKDELSAVVGVVKGFDELIGGLKSDIESMKGDLYGIAGKKKTVKKEVKEDE